MRAIFELPSYATGEDAKRIASSCGCPCRFHGPLAGFTYPTILIETDDLRQLHGASLAILDGISSLISGKTTENKSQDTV